MKRFLPLSAALVVMGCSRTVPWMSDSEAIERAHKSVLEHLKSPSTAVFINDSVSLSDSTYLKVQGNVDSQNEFGAVIRGHFTVTFDHRPPHQIYWAGTGKTYWGTMVDSLDREERKREAMLDPGYGGEEWLKTTEFFPEEITGRTTEDSARAVQRLRDVLWYMDLTSSVLEEEVNDTTMVNSFRRAQLRWKPKY